MSITQPLIADRAKTSSSRKREIGFAFLKFYCQFRHLRRHPLNKTKDKLPLAFRPKLALLLGQQIPRIARLGRCPPPLRAPALPTGNTALKLGLIRKMTLAFCVLQPFR
jgi:hypothetical protein